MAEYLAKKTEACKILDNWLGEELEHFDEHGCSKVRDFVDTKIYEEKENCFR